MLISVPYRKPLRTGVSRVLQREFNFKGFKIRNSKKKKKKATNEILPLVLRNNDGIGNLNFTFQINHKAM